jgi:uncharacterized protein YegP (UPF0339 family)
LKVRYTYLTPNLVSRLKYRNDLKSKKSASNQFYFVLVAANNESIAKSEMDKTKDGCKNGIASVKKFAKTTSMEDKAL